MANCIFLAAILDFGNYIKNAFYVAAVSGIPENPTIDTNIIHLLQSYQKLYAFPFLAIAGWRPSWKMAVIRDLLLMSNST